MLFISYLYPEYRLDDTRIYRGMLDAMVSHRILKENQQNRQTGIQFFYIRPLLLRLRKKD